MELKVEQVMQVIATADVAVGPKYVSFRDPDAEENSSRWRLSYEDRGKRKVGLCWRLFRLALVE